jgi:molecular chaperone DnaJ
VFVTLEQVSRGDTETIQVQTPAGPKTFQIKVPKGIEDGQRVNYENLMPDGVLQIMFRIRRHEKFERRGLDLVTILNISVFDLILGTNIEFTTIHGQTLAVTIPPRSKPGSNLRIPNHGLEASNAKGDQYLLLSPVIPDTISTDLLTALEKERKQG